MQILVLGGSEFIGRAIVERLRDDHDVTVLNRGTRRIDGVAQLIADRDDPSAVRAALTGRGFDAVVDVSAVDPQWVRTVLDMLPPTRYVYVSSAAVYRSYTPPPTEDAPADGNDAWGQYGRDNAACERLLSSTDAVIFRPTYVYGPHNNAPREHALWAAMAGGETIRVPAVREVSVQFCAVGLLAEAVRAACLGDIPADIYNVADPTAYDFMGYVDLLAAAGGFTPRVVAVTDPHPPARSYFPFRDQDLRVDVTRLGGFIDVRTPTLRDGLAATYAAT